MKPDEVRHLLGGYASGTLSDAEQKLLFDAALEDQVLFDAMADEQALKDLLDDPESRGYLQAVLDEPRLEQPRHELFAVKSVMSAPAPAQAPAAPAPPVSRGRSMWWGLLAAASLALISVVGILRLDRTPPPTEIAKNEQQPPKSGPVPSPVDKAVTPRPPEPARGATAKAPKPLTDAKTADKKEPVKEAEKAIEKDAKPVVAGKTETATELRKQQEERKPEVLARREEAAAAAPPAAIPPPPPPPAPQQQAPAPATSNAGPPPPPQQQNAMGNPRQPGFRNAQQPAAVAQDQAKADAFALSARQLYFAGGSALQTDALLEANKEQTPSRDRAALKRKAASPAPGAVGGGGVAPQGGLTQGRASAAATAPKLGFAMRYQLLRRAGAAFAPVAPGTKFRVGEEVVVVIEKNSGGFAVVNRVAEDGTTIPIAMSIQTNEQARSAPLTVTGPIELVVVLSRTSESRGVAGQQGAQQSEIADGMVYIAEPTSAGRALVSRLSIRVDSAGTISK